MPKCLISKYLIMGIPVQDTSNRLLLLVKSLNNSSHKMAIQYEKEPMSEETKY
jgi:hypothetical protein